MLESEPRLWNILSITPSMQKCKFPHYIVKTKIQQKCSIRDILHNIVHEIINAPSAFPFFFWESCKINFIMIPMFVAIKWKYFQIISKAVNRINKFLDFNGVNHKNISNISCWYSTKHWCPWRKHKYPTMPLKVTDDRWINSKNSQETGKESCTRKLEKSWNFTTCQ